VIETYLRPTENFASKWEQYQASDNILAPFFSLDSAGEILVLPNWLSCIITDTNFVQRTFHLEYKDGTFLIDWDSSIGWNEMPWPELKENKPTAPTLMRAICTQGYYFNYDFTDEEAYRCIRLESLKGQHVIYGYLPASSPLIAKLLPISAENQQTPAIISVRFPENSTTNDQVLIEGTQGFGWILP